MASHRIKLNWIIGVLSVLVFAFLLAYRVGIFQKGEDQEEIGVFSTEMREDRETWMNILQQGEKIGYAHRRFSKTAEGYKILESVFMQINTMGMVQEIQFRTEGNFHLDMTLSSFDLDLQSSLFRFKARGFLKGKTLMILAGTPGSEQKIEFPLKKEVYLSVGMLEALNSEGLKPGDSRNFDVFDPTTLSHRPVKIVALTDEAISTMGRKEKARKVSIDFMGAPQFAWIGRDGTVLREEGSLGMKLERVTRGEALQKIAHSPGADLTEFVSLPANKALDDVNRLKELNLRLDGIDVEGFFLNGGRQAFKEKLLTIRRESVSNPPFRGRAERTFGEEKRYLEPTPLIQSDHPEIQAKAKEIVSANDSLPVKAEKLVKWVYEKIEKKPVLSVPNALETLRNRVGDCNEHAVLLAALARAAGIPAEVEAGLVYQRGRFYYHAWNVLFLGTWVTADAVMAQFPADVTHIRFVRGADRQIDLIRIMGKLRLEILATSQK